MVYVKMNEKLPPEAFTPSEIPKEKVERVGTIQISTTIDKQRHAYVLERRETENGWGWADLIDAGIFAKSKPDVLQERLTALEAEVEAQRRKIRAQQRVLPSWNNKI